MHLETIDWIILVSFLLISLAIGFWYARKNKNANDFFAAGGKMPWWILGVSMVATTFSTDTPNLVTDIVRQNGVSGNWAWWAFLLTGMLTVFVYAALWKKSGVLTDVEFYELRYSGKAARFLRGFRAIYLGLLFNVMIMASVTLAAIKIGSVLLGISPAQTVIIAGVTTVIYSTLGGLKGVLITDFVQFFLSLGGAIIAAYIAIGLPEVGGLSNLLTHENVAEKLAFFPNFSNTESWVMLLIIPLLVQWWSTWYPGAEPGGGGYIAQRMFAAKNADHSLKAVLFFNIAHYAIRPWPWILVALSSLIVFPDLQSIAKAFPAVAAGEATHDMGYPAMLTFIPAGLLGVVITSLVAAYMSTLSTHLNWGSSYIVNDVYKRFVKPDASDKEQLLIGRVITILLMIVSMLLALQLKNALQTFEILLQIGAGTGLIFILRWFWWRINAQSEIAAMIASFMVAVYFTFLHPYTGLPDLLSWQKLLIGVSITTICWIITAYTTKATSRKQLIVFLNTVNPGGPGWRKIISIPEVNKQLTNHSTHWSVPVGILCMVLGCLSIYSFLFSTGSFIYGNMIQGTLLLVISTTSAASLYKIYPKLNL